MTERMTDERLAEIRRRADLVREFGERPTIEASAADVPALLAEVERLRAQLAAYAPPGTLSPGETPALCGTCTDRLCVPGLPGCARCVKAEVERLRVSSELLRDELDTAREQIDQVRSAIEHYIARTRDMDDPDRYDDAEVLRPAFGEVVAMFSAAVGHPPYPARSIRAELAETTHALTVTGEKLEAVRGQRDRAETERNTALAELNGAYRGAEELRSMLRDRTAERDQARAELAKRPKSRLGEQVNRLSNAVGDLERERDDALGERDAAREQVKRAHDPDLIRRAIADPGAYVRRKWDDDGKPTETVPAWSARAVIAALDGTEPGQ